MLKAKNRKTLVPSKVPSKWWHCTITLLGCLVFSGVATAQNLPTGASVLPQLPTAPSLLLKAQSTPTYQGPTIHLQQVGESGSVATYAAHRSFAAIAPGGVLRITLDDAQGAAAAASNPLAKLGELQVEAAKQHRLGVEALYFPNLGAQFDNLHFNKQPGAILAAQGPLGNQHEVDVNLFKKDETVVNLSAVQPVTPLMAIYQLAKIARADENIARAKAGMPVAEIASRVEKNYFDLLVAERELVSAEADARKIQGKWLTASSASVTSISAEQEKDMISAEKAVVGPASKVKELTASLNDMMGLPEGTTLDLVAPEPLVENMSLTEVTDKAMAANAEVIEAEQTSIKAHAANKISKMEYGPNVAIVGGYANQTMISSFVFARPEAYLGVIGTYTIFDFGKREHGVKESKANAEAADLGVSLTKAKVAAAVKSSYYELERSRQFTQLARRMASATKIVEASYQPDDPEVESARAKVEADMFRAELEYRQSLAKLKTLMGEK